LTANATSSSIVQTTYGKVRGVIRDGVAMHLGIHYGADTGGANRFLPPRPPARWTGVRDALKKGSPCPQARFFSGVFFEDRNPPSEDCLVLNVWSPVNGKRLPVMVYFHGGAYMGESGGSDAYDGFELAKVGEVVVVTLNHRVNVFGYGYVGEGTDERFASSGNVGQLDLLAAMHWVRDNIANFSGDPGNVTIFGESGGGGKVSCYMAMPAARGTFHKAIVQSGSDLTIGTTAQAARMMDGFYDTLSIQRGNVVALQQVAAQKMVNALEAQSALRFAPIADGRVLMGNPWDPEAPPSAAEVPMIIGTAQDETAFFMDVSRPISGDDALLDAILTGGRLSKRNPLHDRNKAAEVLQLYRREMPKLSRLQYAVRISTDIILWRNAVIQAEHKLAAEGPPVFCYEFAYKIPFAGGSWAIHGIDLPFVFGHPDYPAAWGNGDSEELRAKNDPEADRYPLALITMKAWAAFAYKGNPSTHTLQWPAYNRTTRSTMTFDRRTRLVSDPRGALRPTIVAL
jgi:para-nitrobenzyl esterase